MTSVLDPPRCLAPDVHGDLTRRRLLTGGAGAEPEDGAFPVTIEHKHGSTTIPAQPERVVVVGQTDQEPLLALGVVPVATAKYVADHPGAIHPWARGELGDAPIPEVLDFAGGIPFERIAALRPDLILAVHSYLERADYDTLAQIAPTVAQPKGFIDAGAPWQAQTRIIGRAVGQPERAERLVADVEARFAQVRAAHPEFEGATAIVASHVERGGSIFYWPPPDVVGRFMADLGFVAPAGLAELPAGLNYGQVSRERVDLFDADVLIWWYVDGESGRAQIRADPLYTGLDVATQGRDIYLFFGTALSDALSFQTVLGLPFLLDRLVPLLAAPSTAIRPRRRRCCDDYHAPSPTHRRRDQAGRPRRRPVAGRAAGRPWQRGRCGTCCGRVPPDRADRARPVQIPSAPERIVTLGAEADAVVALGRTPVAMDGGFPDPSEIDPWLVDRLGGAEVDGVEGLGGELGSDAALVVAEADERAQQRGGFGEVGRVGEDLAAEPVVQQDLHGHRAPSQRVAGPVAGAEPQQRLEQPAVVAVVEAGPERRAEEALGERLLGLGVPVRALVAGAALGQQPGGVALLKGPHAARGMGLSASRWACDRPVAKRAWSAYRRVVCWI
ncbi:MAG: ABC transporter substrate-binding protein, partial [Egibacteraceae bacterium]